MRYATHLIQAERRIDRRKMGIHNKHILTERVRKLEEDMKKVNKALEDDDATLNTILSQQDRTLKILEKLTDGESYHKWLREEEKKEEKKPSAESQTKNSPK